MKSATRKNYKKYWDKEYKYVVAFKFVPPHGDVYYKFLVGKANQHTSVAQLFKKEHIDQALLEAKRLHKKDGNEHCTFFIFNINKHNHIFKCRKTREMLCHIKLDESKIRNLKIDKIIK